MGAKPPFAHFFDFCGKTRQLSARACWILPQFGKELPTIADYQLYAAIFAITLAADYHYFLNVLAFIASVQ
jgi:hypothetical protein